MHYRMHFISQPICLLFCVTTLREEFFNLYISIDHVITLTLIKLNIQYIFVTFVHANKRSKKVNIINIIIVMKWSEAYCSTLMLYK